MSSSATVASEDSKKSDTAADIPLSAESNGKTATVVSSPAAEKNSNTRALSDLLNDDKFPKNIAADGQVQSAPAKVSDNEPNKKKRSPCPWQIQPPPRPFKKARYAWQIKNYEHTVSRMKKSLAQQAQSSGSYSRSVPESGHSEDASEKHCSSSLHYPGLYSNLPPAYSTNLYNPLFRWPKNATSCVENPMNRMLQNIFFSGNEPPSGLHPLLMMSLAEGNVAAFSEGIGGCDEIQGANPAPLLASQVGVNVGSPIMQSPPTSDYDSSSDDASIGDDIMSEPHLMNQLPSSYQPLHHQHLMNSSQQQQADFFSHSQNAHQQLLHQQKQHMPCAPQYTHANVMPLRSDSPLDVHSNRKSTPDHKSSSPHVHFDPRSPEHNSAESNLAFHNAMMNCPIGMTNRQLFSLQLHNFCERMQATNNFFPFSQSYQQYRNSCARITEYVEQQGADRVTVEGSDRETPVDNVRELDDSSNISKNREIESCVTATSLSPAVSVSIAATVTENIDGHGLRVNDFIQAYSREKSPANPCCLLTKETMEKESKLGSSIAEKSHPVTVSTNSEAPAVKIDSYASKQIDIACKDQDTSDSSSKQTRNSNSVAACIEERRGLSSVQLETQKAERDSHYCESEECVEYETDRRKNLSSESVGLDSRLNYTLSNSSNDGSKYAEKAAEPSRENYVSSPGCVKRNSEDEGKCTQRSSPELKCKVSPGDDSTDCCLLANCSPKCLSCVSGCDDCSRNLSDKAIDSPNNRLTLLTCSCVIAKQCSDDNSLTTVAVRRSVTPDSVMGLTSSDQQRASQHNSTHALGKDEVKTTLDCVVDRSSCCSAANNVASDINCNSEVSSAHEKHSVSESDADASPRDDKVSTGNTASAIVHHICDNNNDKYFLDQTFHVAIKQGLGYQKA